MAQTNLDPAYRRRGFRRTAVDPWRRACCRGDELTVYTAVEAEDLK